MAWFTDRPQHNVMLPVRGSSADPQGLFRLRLLQGKADTQDSYKG